MPSLCFVFYIINEPIDVGDLKLMNFCLQSRPDSNHSRSSPSQNTTPAPHLLSAIDAEIPLQLPLEPPSLQQGDYDQDSGTAHPMHPANPIPSPSPVHNSHSGSTPSLNPIPNSHSYSLPSDITSQLPAGFMPLGPPTPTPSQSSIRPPSAAPSASGSAGRRGSGIYASPNPMTPSAVPLPPSTVPSVHRLYTPGPSPYTIPPRTPSIVAGGAGTPAPSQHHRQPSTASVDPVVVPLPASTIASYRSLGSGRKYSRSNLRRDSSSDDENDRSDDDDATTSSFDSLTTPKMRRRKVSSTTSATTRGAGAGGRQSERGSLVDGSGSKVGGRATPAYATAPTPPDIKYPLPPSSSGSISTPTPAPQAPARTRSRSGSVLSSTSTSVPMGSVVGRAAKVPLPPSSVGSPRSVYTKLSRKAGSAVGGRDR